MTFTKREASIALGVLDGLSNKEIGARLNLTEGTVKVYISKVLAKTGRSSRLDLALGLNQALLPPRDKNDSLLLHAAGAGYAEGAD